MRMGIFIYTDKKDAFSRISGYVWTRPKITSHQNLSLFFYSCLVQKKFDQRCLTVSVFSKFKKLAYSSISVRLKNVQKILVSN